MSDRCKDTPAATEKGTEMLEPCPFCGSEAVLKEESDHHGDFFSLGCSARSCPGHNVFYTELVDRKDGAIAAWNSRPVVRSFSFDPKIGPQRIAEVKAQWEEILASPSIPSRSNKIRAIRFARAALDIPLTDAKNWVETGSLVITEQLIDWREAAHLRALHNEKLTDALLAARDRLALVAEIERLDRADRIPHPSLRDPAP